jgi:hypothetical protein
MASEYQTRYTKGTLSQFFFNPSGSEQLASKRIFFPNDCATAQGLYLLALLLNTDH